MVEWNVNGISAPNRDVGKPRSVRLPNFISPPPQGFFSRMAEFLTEHPVKLPRSSTVPGVFCTLSYGGGFLENLKECFRPLPVSARAVRSRMMVNWKPWYVERWENLRDAIAPPKLPPLKVTSKPVPVRDIWTKDELAPRTAVLSALAHVLFVLVFSVPIIYKMAESADGQTVKADVSVIDISPYLAKLPPGGERAGGGGGGGERLPTPASKGKAPKFAMTQFSKPMVVPRNPNPKLAIEPNLLGPPDLKIPSPALPNYGDPLASLITNSSGPGSGSGIGTGSGGGIGSGTGGGLGPGEGGGTGGGVYHAGSGGVGEPACIYCPTPTFSNEAVKAKYQGPVTLRIIVTADGRATNITVVQGPGLGLEEKAVEAVKTWKFRPAIGPSGKPVAVWTIIEVTFRLL